MMSRTNMASNDAMLFLLPVPQQASFYMSNTLIPLSCAYNDDGVILEIHDMKPRDERQFCPRRQIFAMFWRSTAAGLKQITSGLAPSFGLRKVN